MWTETDPRAGFPLMPLYAPPAEGRGGMPGQGLVLAGCAPTTGGNHPKLPDLGLIWDYLGYHGKYWPSMGSGGIFMGKVQCFQ